jgi:hypothetical protein
MCFATTPFQSQQATYRMRRAFPADEDWSLHGVVLTRRPVYTRTRKPSGAASRQRRLSVRSQTKKLPITFKRDCGSAALAQGGGGGAGGGGAGGASSGVAGGASGAGGAAGTTGGAGTGGATKGAPNAGTTTGSGVNPNATGQRPGGNTTNSRDTVNNQDRNPPR